MQRRFPLTVCHKKSLPLTCDVVEVVKTVEVEAAGLFVAGFWTLAPHAGRPQDVRRPHAAIAPGAGLQNKNCASVKPQTKQDGAQQRYARSPIKLSQTLLLLLLLDCFVHHHHLSNNSYNSCLKLGILFFPSSSSSIFLPCSRKRQRLWRRRPVGTVKQEVPAVSCSCCEGGGNDSALE